MPATPSSPFSIHSLYRQIFKIWRRKRFVLFQKLLAPTRHHSLLDIGGYPGFWLEHPPFLGRIDTLNVHPVTWRTDAYPEHNIGTLVGDGCRLDITDSSYDIAFSNSVIEHVGTWERQMSFAREIRRVGCALWVQTPAYACPIEPHYLAPCIHYLPRPVQKFCVRWLTPWGWIHHPNREEVAQAVDSTRLLTFREMKQLFPDCEIYTERMLGIIPKSYIAVRKFQPS
jgi:hypothetical protein